MISLYDSNILDILPECISEIPNVKALGYAIGQAIKRLIEYSENTSVYAMIDSAPEEILDMLALDLNTQYYDDTLDLESKRNLIRNTFIWYTNAGTPSSVEELVASIFGSGKVEEWYEYGDDPFFFKVVTENSDMFVRMLEKVKNERSHLRVVELHKTDEQTVMHGIGIMSVYKPAPIIEALEIRSSVITSFDMEGEYLVCEFYGEEPDIEIDPKTGHLVISYELSKPNLYYNSDGEIVYEY